LKQQAIILIIAHKESLSSSEKLSLKQCYKILAKHHIKLICPSGLNIEQYRNIISNIEVEFIDPKWHSSYAMFNLLKMNSLLYNKFEDYQYILFYELDAWVFKDELVSWCCKGFDYIGAPWFEGFHLPQTNKLIGVGNGGFSIRNIKSSLRVLNRIHQLRRIRKFWFKSRVQSIWRFYKMVSFFKFLFKIQSITDLNTLLFLNDSMQEDFYWTQLIAKTFSDYKVASIEEAVKFSFEVKPSLVFKMNNYQLPFGCHAWEKYEPDFWKEYISVKEDELHNA